MSLRVVSRLPRQSEAFIEIPLHVIYNFRKLKERLPNLKMNQKSDLF